MPRVQRQMHGLLLPPGKAHRGQGRTKMPHASSQDLPSLLYLVSFFLSLQGTVVAASCKGKPERSGGANVRNLAPLVPFLRPPSCTLLTHRPGICFHFSFRVCSACTIASSGARAPRGIYLIPLIDLPLSHTSLCYVPLGKKIMQPVTP